MSHEFQNFCGTRIRKEMAKLFFTLIIIMTTALSNSLAFADEGGDNNQLAEAGLEFASGLCTLVYLPIKSVYAGVGAIIGGFAWTLSGGNDEVAKSIWEPSIYGTYVIVPDHLTGNESVRFIGTSSY